MTTYTQTLKQEFEIGGDTMKWKDNSLKSSLAK